ncbi:MAG: alpha/beta hydrolase [Erysipelotrichaceae bacterium]|jgi:alpha-glucosidase|nr:alpha/beta hydrolase [Erysipelotrichaceae bacterium]
MKNKEVPYGKLIVKELKTRFLTISKKKIRIWLPEGYDENYEPGYPVSYMQDGQNLFQSSTSYAGEWYIDETLSKLCKKNNKFKIIVVGIDNSPLRINEMSFLTIKKSCYRFPNKSYEGQNYARFIVEEVKQYIDKNYNTNAKINAIGGSSMGGIISFFMALAYPEVFGYALCFTPAGMLHYQNELKKWCKNAIKNAKTIPKMYFMVGKGDRLEQIISEFTDKLIPFLIKQGYSKHNLRYDVIEEAIHNEKSWAEIFPTAIKWLNIRETS